jgi:membrane protease subunit (stomatin/prohibitin family)
MYEESSATLVLAKISQPQPQSHRQQKQTISEWDCIELQNFCTPKGIVFTPLGVGRLQSGRKYFQNK